MTDKLLQKKVLSKQELCIILQISATTLRSWLNNKYYEDLQKLGYTKLQRLLTPSQVNYIVNKLVITE